MAASESRDSFRLAEVQVASRARNLGRSYRDSAARFAGGAAVSIERARKIADAVLYEGYVLYPYRASSGKNQVRWQFGVLAPRPFSEADGSEPRSMQTECVADVGDDSVFEIRVRCLQVQGRQVDEPADPTAASWRPGAGLEVGG